MSASAIPLPGAVKVILPLHPFSLSGPDIPPSPSSDEAFNHPFFQPAKAPEPSSGTGSTSAHLDLGTRPAKSEIFTKYRVQLISLHYHYRNALIEHEVTTRRVADDLAAHPVERFAALSELKRKEQKCLLIMKRFEKDIKGLTEAIEEERAKEEKEKEENEKADAAVKAKNDLEAELKLKLQAMALVEDDKDEEEGGVPLKVGHEY
ncbi:uncharacterized protein H6S33_008011 [Morchella sextelata]|uniref:uncharacterized protein n=1 Tax=Morchella sextelata TaxID=1174677 RepID=UPI001D04918F|nr:uncharacterized protein H6S33_008011 [Morchella sextelata]KAH0603007.1 hypothetical protein H6S33_008011 [Morchella sextelata]